MWLKLLFYLRKNLKEICQIQIVCHLKLDPIYKESPILYPGVSKGLGETALFICHHFKALIARIFDVEIRFWPCFDCYH